MTENDKKIKEYNVETGLIARDNDKLSCVGCKKQLEIDDGYERRPYNKSVLLDGYDKPVSKELGWSIYCNKCGKVTGVEYPRVYIEE